MTIRRAACSCGQLAVACEGDPVRVSLCHCLECQRRTGSVFAVQARFPRDRVAIEGRATEYTRVADSGQSATFRFCPDCGTTVWWISPSEPDLVGVAVGAFADPTFPSPFYTLYEVRRHPWTDLPALAGIPHYD